MSRTHSLFRNIPLAAKAVIATGLTAAVLVPAAAQAQSRSPALTVTTDPLPITLQQKIYRTPAQAREILPEDLTGGPYFEPTDTLTARKIDQINLDLSTLQGNVATLADSLFNLQRDNESHAAQYYASIATINTQLQTGTTPGNPRLVGQLSLAESSLENLTTNTAQMNQLAVETANVASSASFLLEETRAAYSLAGAVEEDHVRLSEVEDSINNTIVAIERILNNVNDAITRTSAYLSTERNNLRTLALAVTEGDLYGKSLANRPFGKATPFAPTPASFSPGAPQPLTPGFPAAPQAGLSAPRPLVKIRFDRPDVDYQQPLYMAVNQALERFPNSRFELVAIHPTRGNAAKVAIESTKARRNGERVLRSLTQMGLPLERIDLSYSENPQAEHGEVHLYIR